MGLPWCRQGGRVRLCHRGRPCHRRICCRRGLASIQGRCHDIETRRGNTRTGFFRNNRVELSTAFKSSRFNGTLIHHSQYPKSHNLPRERWLTSSTSPGPTVHRVSIIPANLRKTYIVAGHPPGSVNEPQPRRPLRLAISHPHRLPSPRYPLSDLYQLGAISRQSCPSDASTPIEQLSRGLVLVGVWDRDQVRWVRSNGWETLDTGGAEKRDGDFLDQLA